MKTILSAVMIFLSANAMAEESCRTDGCVFGRQSEMDVAIDFAKSTSSTVSYVKSIQRVGAGIFRIVNGTNDTIYLKTEVAPGKTEATLLGCFDGQWKKTVCENFKP
jgi:hypothetical protein